MNRNPPNWDDWRKLSQKAAHQRSWRLSSFLIGPTSKFESAHWAHTHMTKKSRQGGKLALFVCECVLVCLHFFKNLKLNFFLLLKSSFRQEASSFSNIDLSIHHPSIPPHNPQHIENSEMESIKYVKLFDFFRHIGFECRLVTNRWYRSIVSMKKSHGFNS